MLRNPNAICNPITVCLVSADAFDKVNFIRLLNEQLVGLFNEPVIEGVETNAVGGLNAMRNIIHFDGSVFHIYPMTGEERFTMFSGLKERLQRADAIICFSATDSQYNLLKDLPDNKVYAYKRGVAPTTYLSEIQKQVGQAPIPAPAYKKLG